MLKKVLSIIILLLIIIAILHIISPIFVPKWIDEKGNFMTRVVKGFYAEKNNSLDVLFIGNSDMYNGMAPMQMWDEYGIAGYSYSSSGQRIWTGYYYLLDALRSQHPDVVVLNVDEVQYVGNSDAFCYRKAYDNMQMSPVKIQAIMHSGFKKAIWRRLTFFLPVLRYHSRIFELTPDDFKYAYAKMPYENKGQEIQTKIKPYTKGLSYMEDKGEKYEIPKKTKKYLDKFIKKCKDEKIKVVLIEIPSIDTWKYASSQAFSQYAKDQNVDFIDFNFLLDEIGFDWTHDTCDKGRHLNIWGAEKVSKYMGEYLHDNYNLPDRRNDPNYAEWFEQSKKYHENIENAIKKVTN